MTRNIRSRKDEIKKSVFITFNFLGNLRSVFLSIAFPNTKKAFKVLWGFFQRTNNFPICLFIFWFDIFKMKFQMVQWYIYFWKIIVMTKCSRHDRRFWMQNKICLISLQAEHIFIVIFFLSVLCENCMTNHLSFLWITD